MTYLGETAVTTGVLGLGKLIPTNTSGRSDHVMLGSHKTNGSEI